MRNAIFVITGATSGMGLHVAQRLAEDPAVSLIVGARAPARVAALSKAVRAEQLLVLPLDVGRMRSVRAFTDAVKDRLGNSKLAGIVCNAGLQLTGPQRLTEDGFDESFAVNYLGHVAVVDDLMDSLARGAVVVTVGSGTHNPDDRLARLSGFRGADFAGPEFAAAGRMTRSGNEKLLGMDRYATGKLCAILHATEMARRVPPDRVAFHCFDPGLMPGTELARDRSAAERFAWHHVLPALRFVVPGISTPRRSGRALVDLLLRAPGRYPTGSYVEYTSRPAPRDARASSADRARELHDYAINCLSRIVPRVAARSAGILRPPGHGSGETSRRTGTATTGSGSAGGGAG